MKGIRRTERNFVVFETGNSVIICGHLWKDAAKLVTGSSRISFKILWLASFEIYYQKSGRKVV